MMELKEALIRVADSLDNHVDKGEPYNLTFFYDKRVPLTDEQKRIMEEWLAHNFRDIWGNIWIKGDANKLRLIAKSITIGKPITIINMNTPEVEEALRYL
jgi:hypothetical protein